MYVGRRYPLWKKLLWSADIILWSLAWSAMVVAEYVFLQLRWLSIPWLPMSVLGIAVAFYMGFKNNASYGRAWEARKIWGGIVNSSRAWAYGVRDLVGYPFEGHASIDHDAAHAHHRTLILAHVAWLDALRYQLRKPESWEHQGRVYDHYREELQLAERVEALDATLEPHLATDTHTQVLRAINPALHIIASQSETLRDLRRERLIDPFAHMKLQNLLDELMALQGKAERIKKFPFPRQYATVTSLFVRLFILLLPLGLIGEFDKLGAHYVWATVPFSAMVSWVFLMADRMGDWSENPFEGLMNDIPISSMARAIERDVKEILGGEVLPPARPVREDILM